jgi:CRISPR system Cascade subunit CasD
MHWLMITLAAPRASFAGPAPGGIRGTERAPTRSALLGLVAAALGVKQSDTEGHRTLSDTLAFACRVEQDGALEVDYHTTQVGKKTDLKKRVLYSRHDELDLPRSDLSTILSERSYRCDYRATSAICRVDNDKAALEAIQAALRKPKWTLYLGRKCSPLAWPLAPVLVEATDWRDALAQFDAQRDAEQEKWRSQKVGAGLWWPLKRQTGRHNRTLHSLDFALSEYAQADGRREVMRRTEVLDRARKLYRDTRVIEFEERADV